MNEKQIRDHIHNLRRFYTDLLIYGTVNLGLIVIWAISGGGYFWPIWVIIGWGLGLGIHAFSLGLLPQVNTLIPFMTTEWEDQEVRRLMRTAPKENAKEAHKTVIKKETIVEMKVAKAKAKPKAKKTTRKKISVKKPI